MNEKTIQPEQTAALRIDSILAHLTVPEIAVDKDKIRSLFLHMWEFENADALSADLQYLTTVGLFIYYSHNVLDDYNIRMDVAREHIAAALRKWLAPEQEKQVTEEKASTHPFKAFVEKNVPRVDDIYTWESFLLNHQKTDEKQWSYKMKKCWFADFFIRYGRWEFIETACMFDKIPSETRKDYVDLKLHNLFAKLGTSCQFTYTPKKS